MKRFALVFFVANVAAFIVPLAATAAEENDNIEQGKMLFDARCPLCHQLPEPSMLKLDQWRRSLTTMQKRMQQAGMSPLSDSEFQQVLDYLATQARD
jgi:mono/diheme cytochrome c family protein